MHYLDTNGIMEPRWCVCVSGQLPAAAPQLLALSARDTVPGSQRNPASETAVGSQHTLLDNVAASALLRRDIARPAWFGRAPSGSVAALCDPSDHPCPQKGRGW
ncbi:MAG: hypothetical protein WDW38_003299 [Sanguina aurantia]